MANFTVTKVTDGDTFEVNPNWEWEGKSGNIVRIANVDAPEIGTPGGQTAKEKLERLIGGKSVELKNAVTMSYGRLVCDVYLNGRNIANQL